MSADSEALLAALSKLETAIKNLPDGTLSGRRDGPLVQHFTPKRDKTGTSEIFPTDDEGAYYTFNRAWERAFKKAGSTPTSALHHLVTRGKHGIVLAYTWAKHYADLVEPSQQQLIQLRVEQLLALISEAAGAPAQTQKPLGPDVDENEPEMGEGSRKKKSKAASETTSKSKVQKPKGRKSVKKNSTSNPTVVSSGSESSSDSSSDDDVNTLAPNELKTVPPKTRWALTQYEGPEAATKGKKPVWKFTCKHCEKIHRSTPRTDGVSNFASEPIKLKAPSNFISYAETCRDRPESQSFENFQEGEERARKGLPPVATEGPTPREHQQTFLAGFIKRGVANPAKSVTKRSYRRHLVEAIVEDDLAFSFAEGGGTLRLLQHMALRNVEARIPHQTVRRDLSVLHRVLQQKLRRLIQDNDSKFSLASDIVTTRGMVQAFCGVIVSFIDSEWNLIEHVLSLIPLDGDHTGKSTGKLVFKTLKQNKIADRLMASAADNASSNGPLNRTLARKCAEVNSDTASARNMQIGCGAHVTNLVAQKITGSLGLSPTIREVDLYEQTRKFPLTYNPETDPDMMAHQAEMDRIDNTDKGKGKDKSKDVTDDSSQSESDSDMEMLPVDGEEDGSESDDSEDELADEDALWIDEDDGDEDWVEDEVATPPPKRHKTNKKKPKRIFTVCDKVHAVLVHVLRSPIRRFKAAKIVRKTVKPKYRHLVFVKGMPVRWNTRLAELDRSHKLQQAFDKIVANLTDGLTGAAKRTARARQKKWEMSTDDWLFVEKLCEALEILKKVTLEFSRKDVLMIPKILPYYKLMEVKLKEIAERDDIDRTLAISLHAGADMATKYIEKALISDYPLLGAVLHPAIRVIYFESDDWDSYIPVRARQLLYNIVKVYAAKRQPTVNAPASTSTSTADTGSKSLLALAMSRRNPVAAKAAVTAADGRDEVDLYLGNISPVAVDFDDPLGWWKANCGTLSVMSWVARDILAIPGVSVSVERLFSSLKHTMTDERASMTAETACTTIITKEWLKAGLADGLDYLDYVRTHNT